MVRTNPLFLGADGFVAADGPTFTHATVAAVGRKAGLGTRYHPRDASVGFRKDWVMKTASEPFQQSYLEVFKAPTTSLVFLQMLQDAGFLFQRRPVCPCCGHIMDHVTRCNAMPEKRPNFADVGHRENASGQFIYDPTWR